jgi:hypothetical protein
MASKAAAELVTGDIESLAAQPLEQLRAALDCALIRNQLRRQINLETIVNVGAIACHPLSPQPGTPGTDCSDINDRRAKMQAKQCECGQPVACMHELARRFDFRNPGARV